MATNFYKQGNDYFLEGTNQKIANVAELQSYAKAGGKEIAAPKVQPTAISDPSQIKNYDVTGKTATTLYGTLKPVGNTISGDTLKVGSSIGNVSSGLPDVSSNQQAQRLFLDQSQKDAETLQTEINKLQAQRLKENQAAQTTTQDQITSLETQRQSAIDSFQKTTDPLFKQGADEYSRMLGSLKQIDYDKQVSDRLSLTNDIVNYSKMMRQELDSQQGGLQSVFDARQGATTQNYTSKIATAQAALQAIDGNFQLAFDIMDKGANAINQIATQRINFLNFVKGLYDSPIANKEDKLLTLKEDEKALIEKAIADQEAKIKQIEDNKKVIQNLMSNPATATIAQKAGILLTDTPDQLAKKLNDYYVKNPTLIPDSIVSLQEKYPDAGINFWDSTDVIKDKISKSAVFLIKNAGADNGLTTNELLTQAQKLVESGQATDLADAINQIQNSLFGVGATGSADAISISEAIKKVESGGNYDAKGASGEIGAYQFMPGTWNSWSAAYANAVLGKSVVLAPTKENQDAVAQWKIQTWLDKGYTPEQIAAAWNAGEGSIANDAWKTRVGTNKYGVNYNTPAYVNKVMGALGSSVTQSASTETKAISDSLKAISIGLTADQKKSLNALVNQQLKDGNIQGAREAIASSAIKSLPAEQQNKAYGRIVAIDALQDIQASLLEYKSMGGDTGIFSGNQEKIYQKLGKTSNPALAQLQNKIMMSIVAYRNAVSGAAFTESEAKTYEAMFPSILKGSELNTANITSLISTFNVNQKSILSAVIGASNYDNIFSEANPISLDDNSANALLAKLSGVANQTIAPQANPYSVYNKIQSPY